VTLDQEEFVRNHKKFQLGELITEQPHPDTINLSQKLNANLSDAIEIMKSVDLKALKQFSLYADQIEKLRKVCQQTLKEGGRIFLCGCGATGRLSMTIEFLWREKFNTDQVISFMAGGDIALVHSLEGFEDYPYYGKRHLTELGFTKNDLLIGSTEGGETPYVLGAIEAASEISTRKPYMLYCNPDHILIDNVERSKKVLLNELIEKICLFVGPMSLSGSTRMQASTVLQLALGFAIVETDKSVKQQILEFWNQIGKIDFQVLKKLIEKEAQIYQQNEFVLYVPRKMAITVFTDTTERSPTFNLPSFEPKDSQEGNPSLCYVMIPQADTLEEAFENLLLHKPRTINWPEIDPQTTTEYLEKFDFSKNTQEYREERLNHKRQYLFEIDCKNDTLLLSLGGVEESVTLDCTNQLMQHTCLKILLNVHSTLLMGLMGRYQSNIMTWVKVSNAKLIDRATRYIQILLKEKKIKKDYIEVVDLIYKYKNTLKNNECVVLKVIDEVTKEQ
jgi:N-acetylmuramic acid 6-phosphate etherase